jgi:hypothetical protein
VDQTKKSVSERHARVKSVLVNQKGTDVLVQQINEYPIQNMRFKIKIGLFHVVSVSSDKAVVYISFPFTFWKTSRDSAQDQLQEN